MQLDSLPAESPGKPRNTGVGSLSLLQGIFLTQELNQGLLHCRQILYQATRKAPIEAEASDKIQYPFLIKTLKLGREGQFPQPEASMKNLLLA